MAYPFSYVPLRTLLVHNAPGNTHDTRSCGFPPTSFFMASSYGFGMPQDPPTNSFYRECNILEIPCRGPLSAVFQVSDPGCSQKCFSSLGDPLVVANSRLEMLWAFGSDVM